MNLKLLLVSSLILVFVGAFSQEKKQRKRIHYNTHWYKLLTSESPNYLEVVDAYDAYFDKHPFGKSIETKEYKNWKKMVGHNFDAYGQIFSTVTLKSSSVRVKATEEFQRNWQVIGPEKVDLVAPMQSSSTTQGVVTCLVQSPDDNNKILIGTVSAGIWMSEDKGETWECVSTALLISQVRGIAFAESNSSVLYAATSSGPVKSVDGGFTWQKTGLDFSNEYPRGPEPRQLVVNPQNEQIVFYSSARGLYKTTDGGSTWTNIFMNDTWDVAFNPGDSQVVYAGVSNGSSGFTSSWVNFWRSTDGGVNWQKVTDGYLTQAAGDNLGRICIAVTPSDPNLLYVLGGKGTNMGTSSQVEGAFLLKSVDSGESFTEVKLPNVIDYPIDGSGKGGGQYTWDMDIAISNQNTDYIVIGGINLWHSTDGGISWNGVASGRMDSENWYHSDIQSLFIQDENIWITSDGGVHISKDRLNTISNRSFGIVAQEVWGFDQAWKSDIMAIGMYHGPIQIRDDNIYDGWYASSGADAGTVMINKGDDRYLYAHPWFDVKIKRSSSRDIQPKITDLGAKLPAISAPIDIFNHNYYHTLYTLDDYSIKKTTDNATNWVECRSFDKKPVRISTCYQNSNVAYVIVGWNEVWKTADNGETWKNVTPDNLISKGKSFSNITIDGTNPDKVWVSLGGKQTDAKVIKTTNGGQSWFDYSGPESNLPAYTINSIVHQLGTPGGVYIGTNSGVYYRNESMNKWTLYSDALPLGTQVWFIRLNYAKNKIRIGTLRGIWENDLFESSFIIPQPMIALKKNGVGMHVQFIDHSVASEDASYIWTFPGAKEEESTQENPMVVYEKSGTYDVTLEVTSGNRTSIQTFTDFIEISDDIKVNLALNKPTFASSDEVSSFAAENATDGDMGTRWASQYNDPQWLYVDLEETYTISDVIVNWEAAFAKNFEIQVSNDNINWNKIAESTNNAKKETEFSGLNTEGRYIRIYGLERATTYGYSIFELEVYGSLPSSIPTSIFEIEHDEICLVVPNPVKDKFTISYSMSEPGDVDFDVYDLYGRKILQTSKQRVNIGKYNQQINIGSAFDAGIYVVVCQLGQRLYTRKFIYAP